MEWYLNWPDQIFTYELNFMIELGYYIECRIYISVFIERLMIGKKESYYLKDN